MRKTLPVLILAAVAVGVHAQPRQELHGRLVWVGDGGRDVAQGVTITSPGSSTARTAADGSFRLRLFSHLFRPGEFLTLTVEQDGWYIGRPLDGKVLIPPVGADHVVEIELYREGSELFWSEERLESFLVETAALSLERIDGTRYYPGVDVDFYVRRWAGRHGWSAVKARSELERWLEQAEAPGADAHRRGLAAFGRGDLDAAAELFQAASQSLEREITQAGEDPDQQTRGLVDVLRLEGQVLFGLMRFEDALTAFEKAHEQVSRQRAPQLWAMTAHEAGVAQVEVALRNPGESRAERLSIALSSFREALHVFSQRSFPFRWAATQTAKGRTLALLQESEGAEHLFAALQALDLALTVRTRRAAPHLWAVSHYFRAAPLTILSLHQGHGYLPAAIEAYGQALEVRTRRENPGLWAQARANRAALMIELGAQIPTLTEIGCSRRRSRTAARFWISRLPTSMPMARAWSTDTSGTD